LPESTRDQDKYDQAIQDMQDGLVLLQALAVLIRAQSVPHENLRQARLKIETGYSALNYLAYRAANPQPYDRA